MRRRTLLAGLGLTSVSGCLRFTGETASGSTETGGTGREPGSEADGGSQTESAGDAGGERSVVGTNREDAIARASSFAAAESAPLGSYDGDGPEAITYPTNSSGASGGDGPRDSVFSSTDIQVDPLHQRRIRIGGDTGRSVRVRNLATGSAMTLEPAADSREYAAGSIEIETEGNGAFESLSLETPDDDADDVELDVTVTGDEGLFRAQAFATYVVELLDSDGAVIGETDGRVFGKGYQWALTQSSAAAFVTRQPTVQADWYVQFELRDADADPVPVANVADSDVFEIDLTEFDVDPGLYDWTLTVARSRSALAGHGFDHFIRFRSGIGAVVVIE